MLKEHDAQHIGSRFRSAVGTGEDVDEVERLEGVNDRDDNDERHCATNQRDRDGHELPDLARAIDFGGLVNGLGDALHRGQQDDGGERDTSPHADQTQRDHGPSGFDQPRDGTDSDPAEDDVE
ncbi:hypothetical protein MSHO_44420 [Mycobacterium shottsii]|uniref:Uncharacterized protein n=1 Tax=Mycobacterium shottsii TaxID=133549 RepID=A0A7I7LHN0_9MYCO|nr:hypothetical protein MSHO_44420 [Mycobacterium shottsii]